MDLHDPGLQSFAHSYTRLCKITLRTSYRSGSSVVEVALLIARNYARAILARCTWSVEGMVVDATKQCDKRRPPKGADGRPLGTLWGACGFSQSVITYAVSCIASGLCIALFARSRVSTGSVHVLLPSLLYALVQSNASYIAPLRILSYGRGCSLDS